MKEPRSWWLPLGLAVLLTVVGCAGASPAAATPAGSPFIATSIPVTPAGTQLAWLLGAVPQAPLSQPVIDAHFDSRFLAAVGVNGINPVLDQLRSTSADSLVGVVSEDPFTSTLVAVVDFGGTTLEVSLAVDSNGLIGGLELSPYSAGSSWSALDRQLAALGPDVGLLAARVEPGGRCVPVHQVDAASPRPTASMFKLFVLGALARQITSGRVRWDQQLTVRPSQRSIGSVAGSLQYSPSGTRVSVEQAATKMISISDNTAADMLIDLVGRSAVESEVRQWSSHPGLDEPFLTTRELFLLHYVHFPSLADRYLALSPSRRAAFLATSVDPLSLSQVVGSSAPRDVGSLEWFASPDDLCRAFVGLQRMEARPGLAPIGTVLSVNRGDIDLDQSQWPTVWFKGGSEPGVLTLGYLARTATGKTFVVVAMVENPSAPLGAPATLKLLTVVHGAFGLLGGDR